MFVFFYKLYSILSLFSFYFGSLPLFRFCIVTLEFNFALETGGVRHAHGGGEALAERAGRDLDAVGVAVLGVAGRLRAPGAQRLEVVELEAVAAEVELDVLGQRAVPDREDEAVAADPLAVAGVTTHDLLEEEVCFGHLFLCTGLCRKNSDTASLLDLLFSEL